MPDNISSNDSRFSRPSFKSEIKAIEDRLKEIYYLCSKPEIKTYSTLFAAVLEPKEFQPVIEEGFSFDPADRYIRMPGKKVRLGKTQGMVFYRLAMSFEKIVSHSKIMNYLDAHTFPKKTNINSLRVQICLLRDMLESTSLMVECTNAQGYMLRYVDLR